MTGAHQQVVSQKLLDPIEHLPVRRGMEPVTPVVDVDSRELEAPGVAAEVVLTFQQGHLDPALRQLESGGQAAGPATENDDPGHVFSFGRSARSDKDPPSARVNAPQRSLAMTSTASQVRD